MHVIFSEQRSTQQCGGGQWSTLSDGGLEWVSGKSGTERAWQKEKAGMGRQ